MHRSYRGSLALRILLITICVVALPLLAYFLYAYHQGYTARLNEIVLRLRALGEGRSLLLTEMTEADLRLIAIIEELTSQEGAQPPLEKGRTRSLILTSVAKGGGYAAAYYITLFPGGKLIVTAASDPTQVGTDVSKDRFTEEVVRLGSASFLGFGSNTFQESGDTFGRFFYVAALVPGMDQDPPGIITLARGVDDLIADLLSSEESTYTVTFSLLRGDGIIFASGNPSLTLQAPSSLRQKRAVAKKGGRAIYEPLFLGIDGVESIGLEIPVRGTRFSLLITAPESEVFGVERRQLYQVVGFFLLLFVVGVVIALWITQRMSRPLTSLIGAMRRVSDGDLTAKAESYPMGFEINMIGNIFNTTIESLRDQMSRAEVERVQRETLGQEFKIGREIQMSILPHKMPAFPGIEVAARYIPAKQVGGDFYDVFVKERIRGDGNDLVLTVADASGKGISACLYSLGLRSILRSYCGASDKISKIIEKTNNLFCEDTGMSGMFVTALTALFHPETRTLSYTACGHTPGFVRRKNGSLEVLTSRQLAMGVILFKDVEEETIQLEVGDLIILYTDGITETHNDRNELFGETRLLGYIRAAAEGSVDAMADGLLERVSDFRGQTAQYDDITLLVARVL